MRRRRHEGSTLPPRWWRPAPTALPGATIQRFFWRNHRRCISVCHEVRANVCRSAVIETPSADDPEALLRQEQAKRALDILSNARRDTGVSIDFSHADGVIDPITFTAYFKFPGDVPVCGLRIGMTVDDMTSRY
jgi:hypothetical protein